MKIMHFVFDKALLLPLLASCLNTIAQPKVIWQQAIGGSNTDQNFSIVQDIDQDFIISMTSSSTDYDCDECKDSTGWDAAIIKVDNKTGNRVWKSCLKGKGQEDSWKLSRPKNGGAILSGRSLSSDTWSDFKDCSGDCGFAYKLNINGSKDWIKLLDRGIIHSTVENKAGGYSCFGYTNGRDTGTGIFAGKDAQSYLHTDAAKNGTEAAWFVKLDNDQNNIKDNCFGGSANWDRGTSHIEHSDGGYVLSGWTQSNDDFINGRNGHGLPDSLSSAGSYDFFVIRLDKNGDTLWTQILGHSKDDYSQFYTEVIELSNGNIVVAGNTNSPHYNLRSTYYLSSGDTIYYRDVYLAWLNPESGQIIQEQVYGGNLAEDFGSIEPTCNGGAIMSIASYSQVSGDKSEPNPSPANFQSMWLVRIDSIGDIIWQKTLGSDNGGIWYPNITTTQSDGYVALSAAFDTGPGGDKTVGSIENSFGGWMIKLDYPTGFSYSTECLGTPTQFNDTSYVPPIFPETFSRIWSFGDGSYSTEKSPTHEYDKPGIYKVELTIEVDCKTEIITHFVPVINDTSYTVEPTQRCKPDSAQIGVSYNSGVTYSWSPTTNLLNSDSSLVKAYPDISTTYQLIIDNGGLCADTVFFPILVDSFLPITISPKDTTVCLNDSLTLIAFGSNNAIYNWISISNGKIDSLKVDMAVNSSNISVAPTETITYIASLSNNSEVCISRDTSIVNISNLSLDIPDSLNICPNDSIQILVQGDADTFLWQPIYNIIDETLLSPIVFPRQNTKYHISATKDGCDINDSTLITVDIDTPLKNNEKNYCIGISQKELAIFSNFSNAKTYLWENGDTLESTLVSKPGKYRVLVGNYSPNCTSNGSIYLNDTVSVTSCNATSLFIPNAISNNQDNLNDIVNILHSFYQNDYKFDFKIFDRYGNLLFQSSSLDNSWNDFLGNNIETSVLTYHLQILANNRAEPAINKVGSITVLK